jgi:hypothetical protein
MRFLALVCFSIVVHAQTQNATPVCRTPLGIPCHTIRVKTEQWILGISDFQHSKAERVTATSSDGSIYSMFQSEGYVLYRGAYSYPGSVQIYQASTDQVIRVFPDSRTFSSRAPLIWHDRPYRRSKVGDSTCSTGILHNGTDFKYAGFQNVLGMQTARWHRDRVNGGYEDRYLAVDLDCAELKSKVVSNNWLHVPVFIDSYEANKIEWGEPDQKLFLVPTDYRQVPDRAR